MPNQTLTAFRESARAQAAQYLEDFPAGGFSRLKEDQLPEKKLNVAAWKGNIPCGDEPVEIIIALPISFPDELPNIYLPNPPTVLPHMTATRENHICYANSQEVFSLPERPAEIIKDALRMAGETISGGLTGDNKQDFIQEFEAYWADHDEAQKWISLLKPGGKPRAIARLALGKTIDRANSLFGENEEQCIKWLGNTGTDINKPDCHENLYLPLREAFIPPFPSKNNEIYRLLSEIDQEALAVLCNFLTKHKKRLANYVLFSVPIGNHYAFGGWEHSRPRKKKRNEVICPGFRDDRVTGEVQLKTCFPYQPIIRASIRRADPVRLQARVGSIRGANLLQKTVLLIGCGSIGCRIANLLSLGGVGELLLADDDIYGIDNLARHILPAEFLGDKKADSLAIMLKAQSPHLEAEPYHQDFYKVMATQPEVIIKADLVLAATGNRNLEFRLNSLLNNEDKPRPAIYAWTEARGIGSHALLTVPGRGGCLRCAFKTEENNDIRFKYAVDTRLASEVSISEEGCGTTFQPFSALVAEQAALIASEMALAYLHGNLGVSSRWHYLGDLNAAKNEGIHISERYKRYSGDELLRSSFPRHQDCPECKR